MSPNVGWRMGLFLTSFVLCFISMITILSHYYWVWHECLNIFFFQMFGLKLNKYEKCRPADLPTRCRRRQADEKFRPADMPTRYRRRQADEKCRPANMPTRCRRRQTDEKCRPADMPTTCRRRQQMKSADLLTRCRRRLTEVPVCRPAYQVLKKCRCRKAVPSCLLGV